MKNYELAADGKLNAPDVVSYRKENAVRRGMSIMRGCDEQMNQKLRQ